MKKKFNKIKNVALVITDVAFLWYGTFFFTVASSFLNLVGVTLIILLGYLNYKTFLKKLF